MRGRDQLAEPADKAGQKFVILNREIPGPFEIGNPLSVDRSDQEENQQVCIDQNALGTMLLDQGLCIQAFDTSRILIESTSPVDFTTVNVL